MRFPIIESIYNWVSETPLFTFFSKIAHYQERKGEKMTQHGQIREFRWPTTIRTEILREILHTNFEGCFRI